MMMNEKEQHLVFKMNVAGLQCKLGSGRSGGPKQNIPHGAEKTEQINKENTAAEKDTPTWDHSLIIPSGTTTIDMEHEIFFLDLPKDKKQ